MPSQIERMITAIEEAFAGDDGGPAVALMLAPPPTITSPAVIVAPGDPFLTPETHGLIVEHWQVLAAVSLKTPDRGVVEMRNLSLRIRAAVSAVGAIWEQTSGLRFQSPTDQTVAVGVSRIRFKYDPADVLNPEP